MNEDSGVLCCFCNEGIISTYTDPCDISIACNWDRRKRKKDQFFWCHLKCFKEKLHKDIQQHLFLEFLSDDDDE